MGPRVIRPAEIVRDNTLEARPLTVFSVDILEMARFSIRIAIPFTVVRSFYRGPICRPPVLAPDAVDGLTLIAGLFTGITAAETAMASPVTHRLLLRR